MLELYEIFSDYKTWMALGAAAVSGIWIYLTGRKKIYSSIKKEGAEVDAIRYSTYLSKEKRSAEKELDYEERIEKLLAKLDFLAKELEQCRQLKEELLILNKELNAEKNLWLTVNL